MAVLDEELLVERATGGDAQAFEALLIKYEKGVYNLAYRLVSDREDAMDIVQEVFLKAFQALPRFRGDSRFSTWLHRVCVNACLDFLRKKQRTQAYSLDEPLKPGGSSKARELRDDGAGTEDVVETKTLSDEVLGALSRVDEAHRTIVILADVRGYSYQETADILGLSIGTVKSRLHRARNALRKCLYAEHPDPSLVKNDVRRDLM